MVTPDYICLNWQLDSVWEQRSSSSLRVEVAFSAESHAAQGRLGVSALYPPHLHGLTQFSKRLAVGGGDSLGEAKNTTPRIRQLHCRGIPRIAILALHRVVGT